MSKKQMVLELKQQGEENGFCETIYKVIKKNGIKLKRKTLLCTLSGQDCFGNSHPNVFNIYSNGEPSFPLRAGVKMIIDGKKEVISE